MPARYTENCFPFSGLEPIPGMLIDNGYAVINPGSDWTIEAIYAGLSESNMLPVTDAHAFALIHDTLIRDHSEDIAAMFGPDLNAGLGLGAHQYGIGRAA